MNLSKATILIFTFLCFAQLANAQRGKDGSATVSTANTIVNTYTYLTVDATAGATSISVNNNAMLGGIFGGALAPGDLILIVQMQGATINNDPQFLTGGPPATGGYSVPNGFTWFANWFDHAEMWGSIGNDFGANGFGSYNNSGKFEQVEVLSIAGGNTINLQCGLKNNYTVSGHVQIVRVPRYINLTVSGGLGRIVPPLWNGQTGGVVALEVDQTLSIAAGSSISASGYGFRGGQVDASGKTGSSAAGTLQNVTFIGTPTATEGSEKGEGIAGYTTEYLAIGSRFGISAAANGGGGAGYQNCGGGGGSNIYTGALPYRGTGVPDQGPGGIYTAAWNLDISLPPFPNPDIWNPPTPHLNFLPIGTTNSPGGGRGGYSLATVDNNELVVGPRNSAWGGDARKSNGGLGGHPLAYDPTRIFAGGGGGAGDQDSGEGGSGGRGGGLVFVTCYGTVTGSGIIEANGAAGQNSNPAGGTTSVGNPVRGEDGAGGGGGGGSIYIQNRNALPASINLNAQGGNGGNMALLLIAPGTSPDEASGPGGGGAGGAIAFTSGTPTQNTTAGNNGIVTTNDPTPMMASFPPNGATRGFVGVSSLTTPFYDIIPNNATICAGNTANLSVTIAGTLPGGSSVQWYTQQFGGVSFNSGLTWTTPILATTTTYYVGVCPGTFRIPITVTVNPIPTLIITNPPAVCAPATVDLTAASVTAGSSAGTLSYWTNAGATIPLGTPNAVSVSGTYYIQLTNAGCSTVQPVTVTINPAQNASFTMTPNCFGGTATITGVPGGTFTFNPAPGDGAIVNASTGAVTNGNVGTTYFVQYTTPGPCPASLTQSVTAATTLTYSATITDENCGAGDGQIVLTASNGSGGPYQYSITGGAPYQLSGTFGSLSAGTFNISILDNSGCEITGTESISSTGGPSITNMAVTNPSCAGACDGSITATVSGGTLPYTFQWYNASMTPIGTNSATITGLCAGNYSVQVTDASGAAVTVYSQNFDGAHGWTLNVVTGAEGADANYFVVNSNEAGVVPPGCGSAGGPDRSLHVTSVFNPAGGAAYDAGGLCGLLFCPQTNRRSQSPMISTVGQSGLTLNFDFIANGDPGLDFATVWYNDGFGWTQLGAPLSSPLCGSGQGQWTAYSAALPASCNNIPNLQIAIRWQNNDDGVGTDPSVAVDDIQIVTSAAGCPAIANATLTDPPALTISGNAPICIGGTVTLTGSGTPNGATPWTSANAAIATVNNAGLVTGVSAGSVNITYMDINGCTAVQSVTVLPSPTISGNAPICIGGTVQLTGSGTPNGATPWASSNPAVATVNSTGLVTGVSAGSTTITYMNSSGCTNTVLVTVNPNPTISGNAPICIAATVQLTGSGTPAVVNPWVSSNPAVATVSNTGLVTGVTAGTTTITYTNSAGCQNTVLVTVNPNPTISGNTPICVGATVQLTGSGTAAAVNPWVSSNPAVATVNSTGLVTGVSAGSSTITYTDNAGCQNTVVLTVNPGPTVSGNAPVCVGSTLQLTGSGTPAAVNPWVSANPAVATVSNTGLVTGVSGGTVNITYTNNAGCQTTVPVTVVPLPVISTSQTPLTGCNSNDGIITVSAGFAFTGTVTWTGTAAGSAVGVTLPYNITGLAAGTYNVTFTEITSGCTSTASQQILTNPGAPVINPIANYTACNTPFTLLNANITGTGLTGGQAYYTATGGPTGAGVLIPNGTVYNAPTTITVYAYDANGACSSEQSFTITIYANPTISGNAPICIGGTVQLTGSGTPSGGTPWASSNPAVATVNSTGLVTGVSAGSSTITYTDANGCQNTAVVTVNPTPTISGNAPICIAATVQLTGSGTAAAVTPWTSSNPAVATVSNTGLVTGVSAGTTTITYTDNAGCQNTVLVTVNPNPTISGNAPICVGSTVQLTGSGTAAAVNPWISSNPAVATVNNTGLVTGVSAGSATITYTNNNGCQSSVVVTVNAAPTISGNAPICIGSTLNLTGSGTPAAANPWVSSNPGVATVSNTGVVTAVSAGTTTITYTDNGGCSSNVLVTVNALPVINTSQTPLTGCNSNDGIVTVSDAGGATGTVTWSGTASGSAVGVTLPYNITGLAAGTYNVTFTNAATGCTSTSSQQILNNPGAPVIDPIANYTACNTSYTLLNANITGSGLTGGQAYYTATGGPSGAGTLIPNGTVYNAPTSVTVFAYDANGACASEVSFTVTVYANPTISGNTPVCVGATVQLTGSGTAAAASPWVSSNPAVATVSNTGLVSGVSGGTSTITYTDANGCQNTTLVTVNPTPTISGNAPICVGATVQLTGSGTAAAVNPWVSSNPAVATVSNTGLVTGVSAGTATITYTDNAGCQAAQLVTVNPGPTISGYAPICVGATVQLTGSGTAAAVNPWVSSNPAVATVSNTGLVTGVSAGTATITYTNNAGCQATQLVTVNANPTISGNAPICVGATVQLTGSGTPAAVNPWVSSNPAVATVSNTGLVTGVSAGTATITYTNNAGCQATQLVTVNANPTISGNAPICVGATVQLTGSGTPAAANPWVSSNPAVATVSNTGLVTGVSAGTVTITYTNNAGCQATTSITVNANPTISGNAPICLGGTLQLTGSATPNASTPWSSSNPAVATVSNTGLVTSVSAGTTTITYMNNNGCTITALVTVNALPVINTSQTPLTGCNSNDGIITVSDAGGSTGTVSWSGTASGSAVGVSLPYNITGLGAGTYDVSFTNAATGCTSAVSQEIFTNPGAPDVFDLADQTACDAYMLPTINGTGLTGNESYWTGSGGTGTQIAAGTSITSTTTLYIYDSNGGCPDEESVLITIVPTPAIDPITDVTACGSYTLTAITGVNLNAPQYYNGPQPGANVISGTLTSSQTVYVYDANGACSDEFSFQVTINPDPQVTAITGGGSYCQGDVIGDILVDVTGTPGWTLNYTLDGTAQTVTGSSSPISLGNAPGVYVLVDISDANCAAAANGTQTIVVNPIPGAPVAGTDATYCENAVFIDMTASGAGGTMTWYSDPSLTTSIGVGTSMMPSTTVGTTIYYVTETLNGCEGPASMVTITVENCDIIVPTAFTPDADLVNDYWEILFLDENYPDNIVTVYNRWGNVVFEHRSSAANPYSQNMWDGTYQGSQLPVASYFFIIDFNDGVSEAVKGTVSILRNE